MRASGGDERQKIAKAAGIMSFATLISRILGYVKDMILARYFGATGTADSFFVAFRIPNLLRELFAEGSMSSAFIPVLTEYRTKHGPEAAERLVRITFAFILRIRRDHMSAGDILCTRNCCGACTGVCRHAGEILFSGSSYADYVPISVVHKSRGACNGGSQCKTDFFCAGACSCYAECYDILPRFLLLRRECSSRL